jgi:YidC/Oxa1 family membrane protein insertase
MWDIIVNPFITILTLLYSVLNNDIVLAISVLTIGIRLLTSPLLIQQQRSARAMQEVQPLLAELKEKHKNDREKMAQAQMQLYKEHGINPLGGCLPLLVQLPILLALYQAIIYGLAATPFQLIDLSGRLLIPGLDGLVPLNNVWLNMDLTLPPTVNPVYALIFPVLVLVTTWLQSKLTIPPPPPSEDGKPNQMAAMTRSMTTIMPLMFGFFSLTFSVGLSIYFVVSNVVGIIQYSMMGKAEWGRLLGRAPAAVPKPATAAAGAGGSSGALAANASSSNSNSGASSGSNEKDKPVKAKTESKRETRKEDKKPERPGAGPATISTVTPQLRKGKVRKMRKASDRAE